MKMDYVLRDESIIWEKSWKVELQAGMVSDACSSIIFRMLKQEDQEFEATLKPCLKNTEVL